MDGDGGCLSGVASWNGGAFSAGLLGADAGVYNRSDFWYNINSVEEKNASKSSAIRSVSGFGLFLGRRLAVDISNAEILAQFISPLVKGDVRRGQRDFYDLR